MPRKISVSGESTGLNSSLSNDLTNWLTPIYNLLSLNHMVKSESIQLDLIFHALSDGTRRSILRGITKRQKTVGEIAKPFEMSLAAVSKHLKVLEKAKLIERKKEGSFQIVREISKSWGFEIGSIAA